MPSSILKSTGSGYRAALNYDLYFCGKEKSWRRTVQSSVGFIGFYGLIVLLNGHLLGISDIRTFLFLPDAVGSGQWWRLLTFSFVHVSWYHLVLDVGAFVYLYSSIRQNNLTKWFHVFLSGAFSLSIAFFLSPEIRTLGLCGLSGIDHGLLVITSLGMIKTKNDRRLGYACLSLVIAKCVYEMTAGDVFLSSIHHGLCGTPLVACHLGGVVGGLISFFLCRESDNKTAQSKFNILT